MRCGSSPVLSLVKNDLARMTERRNKRRQTLPKAKGVKEHPRALSCFKQFTVSQRKTLHSNRNNLQRGGESKQEAEKSLCCQLNLR
jgi:hypothetical protein